MKKEEIFNNHLECVAILAGVSSEFILSRSRETAAVRARSAVTELCMRDGMSDAEIGIFLKRDRTSVTHLRNYTIPSFSGDTVFHFYVNTCHLAYVAV